MYVLIAYLLGILTGIKKQNQKNPASDSESTSERSSCPSHPIIAEVRFPETVERERRTHEQKQHSLQKHLVIATWCTFIAVFIYAGITLAVWQATNKAANAAKDSIVGAAEQFRADQRAWLAVGVTSDSPKVGKNFPIVVELENTGKTPAVDVRLCGLADTAEDRHRFPDFRSYGPRDCTSTTVLPPVGRLALTVFVIGETGNLSRGLDKEQVDSLTSGKVILRHYGEADYADTFGCKHWIKYCYERITAADKTAVAWLACANGTSIDTDPKCMK